MNSYYIKDSNNREYTYIKLRILTQLECDIKIEKLSYILEFLEFSNFIPHLTFVYYNFKDNDHQAHPENIEEEPNIPSLSIDMKDHKMRFKYWDGSKTYWVYHLDDLSSILIEGRNEFKALVQKYQKITEIIFSIQDKYDDYIANIRYKYYPEDNRELDILYTYTFSKKVKDENNEAQILKEVNDKIELLEHEILKDVNFGIDFDYEHVGCTPCEENRRKREENERKNKENQK